MSIPDIATFKRFKNSEKDGDTTFCTFESDSEGKNSLESILDDIILFFTNTLDND